MGVNSGAMGSRYIYRDPTSSVTSKVQLINATLPTVEVVPGLNAFGYGHPIPSPYSLKLPAFIF